MPRPCSFVAYVAHGCDWFLLASCPWRVYTWPMGDGTGQAVTPIERARSDIRRMRAELARAQAQVASLESRIAKTEAYVEMAAVYEVEDTQHENGKPRSAGGAVALATQAAKEILRETGQSLPTRQILKRLEERGIQVGGRDPVANLSGFLSRDDDFTNSRATGWALSEWGGDTAPAKAEPKSFSENVRSSGGASWDAPKGGDLDDEIPF